MPIPPVDLSKLKTYSIRKRGHKVASSRHAALPAAGASFRDWWEGLPPYLGASQLQRAVEAIVAAHAAGRPVVWALGAHVVKVGCGPLVADLMRRGIVTAVAMNGATAIHDFELAAFGETSEEVADTIRDGRFGMVRETAEFFGEAVREASRGDLGLGAAIGKVLAGLPEAARSDSILVAAHTLGIPATVHVALGTDTVHMHPQVDPAALGAASATDFRICCAVACRLGAEPPGAAGGVWCNIGSAVVLPEVFLKAVAVARNLGHDLDAMTAVNLDMQSHYRPRQNVIGRPVTRGRGIEVIGHHEILLPLIRQALIERIPL